MSTNPAGSAGPAAASAWHELLLAAGTLPPRDEPAEQAVLAWQRARMAPAGQMTGPLVWLDRDLGALPAAVTAGGAGGAVPGLDRVAIHLVLWDTPPTYARSVGTIGQTDGVDLVGVHTRLPVGGNPRTSAMRAVTAVADLVPDDVAGFTEVPLEPGWPDALDVLADYGQAAAVRLGEPMATAPPPARAVAEFVIACIDRDIGFATVGGPAHLLPTGEQPGFGTMLLATRAALDGAGADDTAQLLAAEPTRADLQALAGPPGSLREYLRAVCVPDLPAALVECARRLELDRP